MIFNSFQFIWLFPLIFAAYWISYKCNSRRFCVSKYLLLAISYGVYIQWSPIFGLVLFAITLLTYLFAILIANHPAKRKFLIWTGSLLTLSPLLLFKYFNFVNSDDKGMAFIRALCRKNDIPLYDFSSDPKYYRKKEYFYDLYHMNQQGAEAFSKDLATKLIQILGEKSGKDS